MMFNGRPVSREPGASGFFRGYWDAPKVKEAVKTMDENGDADDDSTGKAAVAMHMLKLEEPKLA